MIKEKKLYREVQLPEVSSHGLPIEEHFKKVHEIYNQDYNKALESMKEEFIQSFGFKNESEAKEKGYLVVVDQIERKDGDKPMDVKIKFTLYRTLDQLDFNIEIDKEIDETIKIKKEINK